MKFYVGLYGPDRNKEGFYVHHDNWNDFGFVTLHYLTYVDSSLNEYYIGAVKIGERDYCDNINYKNNEEYRISLPNEFNKLPEDFYTLGQDISYYENIMNLKNIERSKFYESFNDVAYNAKLLNAVESERMFQLSLIRFININTVKSQFRRISHGGDSYVDFVFKHQLVSGQDKSILEFNIKANSLPPTNIHALIGPNGCGKTTALNQIAQEFIHNETKQDFTNMIFITFSIFDEVMQENNTSGFYPITYQNVIYETKTNVQDNHINLEKYEEQFFREFSYKVNNIINKKREEYLYKSLEILHEIDQINFKNTINKLSDYKSKRFIDFDDDVFNLLSELENIYRTLSSGHKIILFSLVNIIELISEKTIILFDEPETHLHPPLLSFFIRFLSSIASDFNAIVIIATHSPVVLQEIPRSCVSIINRNGDLVKNEKPRIETFGENLGVLTREVFRYEVEKTGFNNLLIESAKKLKDYELVLEKFEYKLGLEAKSLLRTHLNNIDRSTDEED